jgi:hypothetical protein
VSTAEDKIGALANSFPKVGDMCPFRRIQNVITFRIPLPIKEQAARDSREFVRRYALFKSAWGLSRIISMPSRKAD